MQVASRRVASRHATSRRRVVSFRLASRRLAQPHRLKHAASSHIATVRQRTTLHRIGSRREGGQAPTPPGRSHRVFLLSASRRHLILCTCLCVLFRSLSVETVFDAACAGRMPELEASVRRQGTIKQARGRFYTRSLLGWLRLGWLKIASITLNIA